MSANDKQVGGTHYRAKIQHWDYAYDHAYDIFQVYITKYVDRWKKKNGVQDLYKARHCLEKYIEVAEQELKDRARANPAPDPCAKPTNLGDDDGGPGPGYVAQ